MAHSEINCIRHVSFFSNLPEKTLKRLVKISRHRQFFKKGDFITTPADPKALMFIDEGRAKVYTLGANGKEKLLYFINAGTIDGIENLFAPANLPKYVQATQDTWVCSMQHDDFQNLLKSAPVLTLELLNEIGSKLSATEVSISRRNLLEARDRILAYFQDWALEAGSNEFDLPLKKQEFASLIGVSPETLSRNLRTLEQQGEIKMQGKHITLL